MKAIRYRRGQSLSVCSVSNLGSPLNRCGVLEASCHGIPLAHSGACAIGTEAAPGLKVRAWQSMLLIHVVWIFLACFIVLAGVM